MSTLYPVTPPIKLYTDSDGNPLEGGYIYYGQPNQNPETTPIQMYWDALGTIPTPFGQPVRTVGGYISRQGIPANIYASGDFSVTIRDSKGQLVITSPNSVDIQLALSIAGIGTAASIPIADAGSYYSTDNVEAALQQVQVQIAAIVAAQALPTGTTIDYAGTAAPTGFVFASGQTIGNVASAATERANADTSNLYTLLWNSYTNSELAIQDSSGTPTTRGVSAAADYAANKRLPLPDCRGRVRAGKDNMGAGSITASRLTGAGSGIVGTTQGASGGTQTHTLATAELASHNHSATQGSHTHTDSGHNHGQNAHTHTQVAHNHAQDAHNHTDSGHNHGQNSHTHGVGDPTHLHLFPLGGIVAVRNDGAGSYVNVRDSTFLGGNQNDIANVTGVSVSANTATNITSTAVIGSATPNIGNATPAISSDVAVNVASNAVISTVSAGAITVGNSGSGNAHQNTQPTIIFSVIIKL